MTKPTDPQDWTRTAAADGTAAEATGTAEGTANGNSAQGTDAQADTERRTEDAWAPSNGIGQPSPSLGSPGAPVDPPTQPVPANEPVVSEPVVNEPVVSEAAPVGESVAGEPAADQRVSAGEPDESVGGRPATSSDPVGLISGHPEAPAAALPPPWQRVPGAAESSGSTEQPGAAQPTSSTAPARRPSPRPRAVADPGEPTMQAGPGGMAGSAVAPESGTAVTGAAAAAAAAAAGAGLPAPGGPPPRAPRPARPEPARPDPAGRTGQSDLGRARTVSLDSGRLAGQASQEGAGEGGERARSGRAQGAFGMSWPRNRRPRQASLQLKRLDPWSVLKIALVLAVVLYLIWLVAVGVLYGVLDGIGVWDRLNGQYADLVTEQAGARLISAGRVFGAAAVIGAVNSLLFAVALSVGAFVYNVSADLVGGVEVTLSERD